MEPRKYLVDLRRRFEAEVILHPAAEQDAIAGQAHVIMIAPGIGIALPSAPADDLPMPLREGLGQNDEREERDRAVAHDPDTAGGMVGIQAENELRRRNGTGGGCDRNRATLRPNPLNGAVLVETHAAAEHGAFQARHIFARVEHGRFRIDERARETLALDRLLHCGLVENVELDTDLAASLLFGGLLFAVKRIECDLEIAGALELIDEVDRATVSS